MTIHKISLGTVQFGLPYGIQKNGQVSVEEAHCILTRAHLAGINSLDTAEAYGKSEEVLGSYIQKYPDQFKLLSKFVATENSLQNKFNESLSRLHVKKLEGYYYHRFTDFEQRLNWDELVNLKKNGLINRIGVSLYTIEELKKVLNEPLVDLIQLPFNLLDHSNEKRELMEKVHEAGKMIVIRSVFLQGLFFMNRAQVSEKLQSLMDCVEELQRIAAKFEINVSSLALNYALSRSYIDQVLIGVDSLLQLEENIGLIKPSLITSEVEAMIERVQVQNTALLNPGNWN